MSKRYGKNQKRKHRERIADLERQNAAAVAGMRALSSKHQTLLARVQDWDAEISNVLGELSAFRFKMPRERWQWATRDGVTVPLREDMQWNVSPEAAVCASMTTSQQRLASMRVESREDMLAMRRIITVASECDGRRLFFYNYGLSRRDEVNVRRHEREFLAEEIFRLFCRERDANRIAA
jgi:hypothetical protein